MVVTIYFLLFISVRIYAEVSVIGHSNDFVSGTFSSYSGYYISDSNTPLKFVRANELGKYDDVYNFISYIPQVKGPCALAFSHFRLTVVLACGVMQGIYEFDLKNSMILTIIDSRQYQNLALSTNPLQINYLGHQNFIVSNGQSMYQIPLAHPTTTVDFIEIKGLSSFLRNSAHGASFMISGFSLNERDAVIYAAVYFDSIKSTLLLAVPHDVVTERDSNKITVLRAIPTSSSSVSSITSIHYNSISGALLFAHEPEENSIHGSIMRMDVKSRTYTTWDFPLTPRNTLHSQGKSVSERDCSPRVMLGDDLFTDSGGEPFVNVYMGCGAAVERLELSPASTATTATATDASTTAATDAGQARNLQSYYWTPPSAAPTPDPTVPGTAASQHSASHSFAYRMGLGNLHIAVEDVVMSGLLGILVALVGIVIVLHRQPEAEFDQRGLLELSERGKSVQDSSHSYGVTVGTVGPLARPTQRTAAHTPRRISVQREKRSAFSGDGSASVVKDRDRDSDSSEDEDEESRPTRVSSSSNTNTRHVSPPEDKEIRIVRNPRTITPRRQHGQGQGQGQGWGDSQSSFLEGIAPSSASTPGKTPAPHSDLFDSSPFSSSLVSSGLGFSPPRLFKSPARLRPDPRSDGRLLDSPTSSPSSSAKPLAPLKFNDTVAAAAAAVAEYTSELPSFASLAIARLPAREMAADPIFGRITSPNRSTGPDNEDITNMRDISGPFS